MNKYNEDNSKLAANAAESNTTHKAQGISKRRARAQEKVKAMPKVYVVSRYAGNVPLNTINAIRYCRFVMSQQRIPVASHLLYPRILDDDHPNEREIGLLFGQALLAVCDEVWVFGTTFSSGMQAEIEEAQRLNKPLRFFIDRMEETYETH